MAACEVASFKMDSGTLEAETSVSQKAECVLAIGKDKKVSSLEWLSPLIEVTICSIYLTIDWKNK